MTAFPNDRPVVPVCCMPRPRQAGGFFAGISQQMDELFNMTETQAARCHFRPKFPGGCGYNRRGAPWSQIRLEAIFSDRRALNIKERGGSDLKHKI